MEEKLILLFVRIKRILKPLGKGKPLGFVGAEKAVEGSIGVKLENSFVRPLAESKNIAEAVHIHPPGLIGTGTIDHFLRPADPLFKVPGRR